MNLANEAVNFDASKLSLQVQNGIIAPTMALDMDGFDTVSEHPKKRRRRPSPSTPVSARLVGVEHLRGITGLVSDDLWTKVFGSLSYSHGNYSIT